MKLVSILFLSTIASFAQQNSPMLTTYPLYIIQAENSPSVFEFTTTDNFAISSIDPSWIASISVLKGPEALARYGDKGANGAVIITIAHEYKDKLPNDIRLALDGNTAQILFVFQKTSGGRQFQTTDATAARMDQIDPSWIESITVIKDEDGKKKYGKAGANGVVVIRINSTYISRLPETIRTQLAE